MEGFNKSIKRLIKKWKELLKMGSLERHAIIALISMMSLIWINLGTSQPPMAVSLMDSQYRRHGACKGWRSSNRCGSVHSKYHTFVTPHRTLGGLVRRKEASIMVHPLCKLDWIWNVLEDTSWSILEFSMLCWKWIITQGTGAPDWIKMRGKERRQAED